MCEINPKQSAVFRLEVFTSERMTEARFLKLVAQKLLTMEMLLNEDMHFRFHIHKEEKRVNKRTK